MSSLIRLQKCICYCAVLLILGTTFVPLSAGAVPEHQVTSYPQREHRGHFTISNESWTSAYLSIMKSVRKLLKTDNLGFIGVGAEQNYTFMSALKPNYVWLVDHDADIARGHYIAKVAFINSPTREEFINFFKDENFDKSSQLIKKYNEGASGRNSAETVSGFTTEKLIETLNRNSSLYYEQFKKLVNYRDLNFLYTELHYESVRDMFLSDKVAIITADFVKNPIFSDIAIKAKALGVIIGGVYLSNALDYFIVDLNQQILEGHFINGLRELPQHSYTQVFATSGRYLSTSYGLEAGAWQKPKELSPFVEGWDYFFTPISNMGVKPAKQIYNQLCRALLSF
jgi:hypothetical protein